MFHSTLYSATQALARCALVALVTVALCLGGARPAASQTMLQASGIKIVNASGQEVILNGMNVGGWQLQEGYMMKPGFGGTQSSIKKKLYDDGLNDAQVEDFYQKWRDNFITKADIDYLGAKGFNCVRLPLHYELFLTAKQRAVRTSVSKGVTSYGDYLDSLTTWYNRNQLFNDPSTLEGVRLTDELLSWCGGNKMYVIFDLHAAPGAQGSDTNISDALTSGGNFFWYESINQDIANRLWGMLAARYQSDPRVAMYDVLNEPNNVPNGLGGQNANQRIHDVLQRFITTIRATGDNHLILLEGNGYGNDFNYMEKFTFPTATNLVYNTHRYDAPSYPLSNSVTASNTSVNQLGLIGNMTRFRTTNNVPIWVGETGENTSTWMGAAAQNLNSVGIGWCHWTLKRFENNSNAALFHINSPYVVDGAAGLSQALENIKFVNCVLNSSTLGAIAPTPAGIVRNATPPIGKIITLQALSNGRYVSGENGTQAMTCTRVTAGTTEQFAVLDAGNGKVYLRSMGKFVSSENGTQPITANRVAAGRWEAFDWFVNVDGSISFGGYNGRYISSESGSQAMTCTRFTLSIPETFTMNVIGVLATKTATGQNLSAYPNPVSDHLTYSLPAGTHAHTLTVADATGRTVLTRSYGDTGAQNTLDTSSLAGGFYVVCVEGVNFIQSFKVTKE